MKKGLFAMEIKKKVKEDYLFAGEKTPAKAATQKK
jgi:hypothetical protein